MEQMLAKKPPGGEGDRSCRRQEKVGGQFLELDECTNEKCPVEGRNKRHQTRRCREREMPSLEEGEMLACE